MQQFVTAAIESENLREYPFLEILNIRYLSIFLTFANLIVKNGKPLLLSSEFPAETQLLFIYS